MRKRKATTAKAKRGLTILGQTTRTPMRRLETFPAPTRATEVTLKTSEWTSLCPVTGQPDFCALEIRYKPRQRCLESKALKLYVWSFRNEAMFVEALADRVAMDIGEALEPHWLEVTVHQAVRGGIAITALAQWP